ncbi:MFS transporter [Streptomyces longispororuber]|uniref:MFS transporter n=1 Tax=Streptomyces longispororuber TaxID=68230 RepID=UPI00210C64BA|nr:MFS transporter [Streptomyces longispororuber]MCQ4211243.1 MFS transporter [Streptomyces longispororuber]
MTAPTHTRHAPVAPAHRDPNVLRWLGAYTTSVTGDVIYFTALTWAVSEAAGPARAGLVLAAGAVPRALLMLGGGVLADRFGPRRVLIGSDLVRCLTVLAAALATYTRGPELAVLCVLAVCFGVADALFMPAVGALPPSLTAREELTRVQGLRSLAVRLANTVGPLAAAAALTAGGAAGAFAGVGALFAVSLVLLAVLRTPGRPAPAAAPVMTQLRDGLRYLRGRRTLVRLVVVIGLGEMCFSGPVGTALVLLTGERGWSPGTLSLLLGAFSVAGAAVGIAFSAVPRVPAPRAVLAVCLALTAVFVTTLGLARPGPGAAVALCALLGAAGGIPMVLGHALLQQDTDPAYIGRVTSVTSLCTLGLSPLLFPLAGVVAEVWGAGVFLAGCGGVCLLAAACATVKWPRTVAD